MAAPAHAASAHYLFCLDFFGRSGGFRKLLQVLDSVRKPTDGFLTNLATLSGVISWVRWWLSVDCGWWWFFVGCGCCWASGRENECVCMCVCVSVYGCEPGFHGWLMSDVLHPSPPSLALVMFSHTITLPTPLHCCSAGEQLHSEERADSDAASAVGFLSASAASLCV
jgi:hypothetical protein